MCSEPVPGLLVWLIYPPWVVCRHTRRCNVEDVDPLVVRFQELRVVATLSARTSTRCLQAAVLAPATLAPATPAPATPAPSTV